MNNIKAAQPPIWNKSAIPELANLMRSLWRSRNSAGSINAGNLSGYWVVGNSPRMIRVSAWFFGSSYLIVKVAIAQIIPLVTKALISISAITAEER